MNIIEPKLRPFAKRVKWLSAWRGLAIGTLVGGVVCCVWAGLDWARILYADWKSMGLVILATALSGAVWGFLHKVRMSDLAASVDRRGQLKDRISTAMEVRTHGSVFDNVQSQDADNVLDGLKPSGLYPLRFGRWQATALTTIVIAASVFLLGNSPIGRGPKTAAEREELKEIGKKVERIANPLQAQLKEVEALPSQKKLASDLKHFARELEEGKLNKEEALRKANDLASKAEDEAKTKAEETQKKAEQIETALGKVEKMRLDQSGVSPEDLETLNLSPQEQAALDNLMKEQGLESPKSQFSDNELKSMGASRSAEKLAQLNPEERQKLREGAAQRQAELQKEIDRIDKLPEAERKPLEKQRQELEKQRQETQKLSEALKLSEETLKSLKELMDSEEMKELRETIKQMQEKAKQTQQGRPPTKEEMEELKKKLDDLAQAMKDPQMKEQVLKQLQEAAKQLESGQMSLSAMEQMMEAMNMGSQNDPSGDPSTGSDDQFADTGKVVKSEREMETKGKTKATRVSGQWDDKKGEQWSVTVKAPTQVGNRTSVPYQNVMPQYRKAAEKALSGGKIPREKEKRVKEYFESLSGGKKS